MEVMFPLFQSVGTSADCHYISNMTDSGLATLPASSLRTCGFISSSPTDISAPELNYSSEDLCPV